MIRRLDKTSGRGADQFGKDLTRRVMGLAVAVMLITVEPGMAELRAVGGSAPDFTLQTLDGKKVSLSNLRGKPVVLEFWATWCGICRRQLPDMIEAHKKYGDKVHFIMVNTAESKDVVTRFDEKVGLPGTVLLDPEDKVGELYGTEILPSIFFVDAMGTIRAANAGALRDVDAFMSAMLKTTKAP